MVQQVFPGFDTVAPVVAELLASPEGRRARLGALDERRAAALAVVTSARPDLDDDAAPPARRRRAGARHGRGVAGAARLLGPRRRGRRRGRHDRHRPLAHPRRDLMDLLTGVNHIAVLTTDLDRFVDFYTDVFDVEVVFTETTPAFRHAIVRTGPTSWLHPAELGGNAARHGVTDDVRPRPPRPPRADRGHPGGVRHDPRPTGRAGRHRRRGRGPRRLPQRVVRPIPTACASSSSSSSTSGCRASTPRNRSSRRSGLVRDLRRQRSAEPVPQWVLSAPEVVTAGRRAAAPRWSCRRRAAGSS